MELLLIRHALPLRLEVDEGPADPDLSDVGRRQADLVAQWLAAEGIDALYVSPLARARQTAAPVAAACGVDLVVDDDLAEWDREANAYIPMEELKATDHEVWRAMAQGRWTDLGIDVDAFRQRVTGSIDAIAARHAGDKVAVVCHGGVINTYTGKVLGIDQLLYFEPEYTGISRVLVSRKGVRSIRSLNEAPHLRGM
jgi:2,3-bisphosphoglycerate-dependent phosphoglycerate mutase